MNMVSFETKSGPPIAYHDAKITPFSQSLRIQPPGFPGGLIWNRPASVLVVGADGQEQVLLVQDITRQIVWTLAGATLLIALFAWLRRK